MKRVYPILAAMLVVGLFASAAMGQSRPWNNQINTPQRFTVLADFGGAAVFDRETGLVWEQSPDTIPLGWFHAHLRCIDLNVGNRKGWRLPTIQELASLIDPSQKGPSLPLNHPFNNVQSSQFSFYWSATTLAAEDSTNAWGISFGVDFPGAPGTASKTGTFLVWCVRGGQGVDPQ